MSQLSADDLDVRIRLQKPELTPTSAGGSTMKFIDIATVSANVQTMGGTELFQAQKQNPKLTDVIRIRFRKDVRADWRVILGDRVLVIRGAYDPDKKSIETRILAEEIGKA